MAVSKNFMPGNVGSVLKHVRWRVAFSSEPQLSTSPSRITRCKLLMLLMHLLLFLLFSLLIGRVIDQIARSHRKDWESLCRSLNRKDPLRRDFSAVIVMFFRAIWVFCVEIVTCKNRILAGQSSEVAAMAISDKHLSLVMYMISM